MVDNELLNFILVAKRYTYAAKKNQVESIRKDSIDFEYKDGDYVYHDSYVGSMFFSGEEFVHYKDKPIWSMNYIGRVIGDNFSGDFLKEALLNNNVEMPYRGPSEYIKDKYKYICKVDGSLDWFNGHEEIMYNNLKIYEAFFHGGLIK